MPTGILLSDRVEGLINDDSESSAESESSLAERAGSVTVTRVTAKSAAK